jgi:hypothetical protein
MIVDFPFLWSLMYHFSIWIHDVCDWLLIGGEPNPFKFWHFLVIGLLIFFIGFVGFLIGRRSK